MSKRNNKTPLFLNLGFLLLLLIFTIAESRSISGGLRLRGIPTCHKVVAVDGGDTCSGVALSNSLTTEFFGALNPNIKCSSLFIGQWLCVKGSLK